MYVLYHPRDYYVTLPTAVTQKVNENLCTAAREFSPQCIVGILYSSKLCCAAVAVQNVERSRTSKVSGSCQKVSGSWQRSARRSATSSSPERRYTYAHAR